MKTKLNLKKKIIWKIKKIIIIFIFLLFLISIAIYFFASESFLFSSIILGMYFLSFYLFLNKTLEKILDENIFDRIKTVSYEIKEIKSGNSKKHLTIQGFDEFDQLIHFTNQTLNDYQKAIEVEKKNSLVDPLTLCFNRRALNSQFDSFKKKAIRDSSSLGFLLIDLDKFKEINDIYGHDVGDEVLKFFSKTLKNLLREFDYLYRLGGEEFLIIFSDINKNNYLKINNRLLKIIPKEFRNNFQKIQREITFSGGFALIDFSRKLNQDLTFDEIFKKLDLNLYNVKNSGRNNIEFQNE